jgi:hypothetical protein
MRNPQPTVNVPELPAVTGLEVSSTQQALQVEVDRVRASGALGEARLLNLFNYLADKTRAGQSPKEIAIAMDVFGKASDFDVSQDALVRVYIHKLRKVLNSFYASAAEPWAVLDIPRGEYRLRVRIKDPTLPQPTAPIKDRRFPILIAIALVIAVLTGMGIGWRWSPRSELDQVRASTVWSAILNDDRPIIIVLGDYYLIGETDDSMELKRLIREFSVNSKGDLERYIADNPDYAARYMDVSMRYLPISAALALRNVMVVLAPQNRRITVSKMSDLGSASLKTADIVYIGYLSGMGMFQDMVFADSRFAVGESYDEIMDKTTHRSYVSEIGSQMMGPAPATGKERTYRDYGLFAKLAGPGGNTILVIAGTRDEGVSQTAEAITNAAKLDELGRQVDATRPLEALLEVSAFNGTNLTGKMLLESNRGPAIIRGDPTPR